MKTDRQNGVFTAIRMAAASHPLLTAGTLLCVAASVAASLLPQAVRASAAVRVRAVSLVKFFITIGSFACRSAKILWCGAAAGR